MMRRNDTITLAEDDRAKVPFAVIGVLLLVTSVSIVVVLETRSEPEVDTDAAQAYDRTSSAVRSVVQGATTRALQNAAAQPVTEPNDSTAVGQALAAGPTGVNDSLAGPGIVGTITSLVGAGYLLRGRASDDADE